MSVDLALLGAHCLRRRRGVDCASKLYKGSSFARIASLAAFVAGVRAKRPFREGRTVTTSACEILLEEFLLEEDSLPFGCNLSSLSTVSSM